LWVISPFFVSAAQAGPSCDMWYRDADGDGHGDPSLSMRLCSPPPAGIAVLSGTDCDDTRATVYPGGAELCDGFDNNCDGIIDEDGVVSVDDGTVHPTIQAAVDAASDGAVVHICEGTYPEAVLIRTDLTLLGRGAGATVIDGSSAPAPTSTVRVQSATVTLDGLTLTGGTGTFNDGMTWGGGLYTGGSRGVNVRDCIIEGNTADIGGGVAGTSLFLWSDRYLDTVIRDNMATSGAGGFLLFSADLRGVEVTGNTATIGGGGGAWYWTVSADATTRIHDNSADFGGGLWLWDDGVWSGGQIDHNSASMVGGGVWSDDNSELSDVSVSNNTAGFGGGGLGLFGADLAATGVVVDGNTAPDGAGVWARTASAALAGGAISGNVATTDGGGVTVGNGAFVRLDGVDVWSNDAGGAGGGAHVDGGTLQSVDSDWGVALGDNTPDDVTVVVGAAETSYVDIGTDETFTCSDADGGCVW